VKIVTIGEQDVVVEDTWDDGCVMRTAYKVGAVSAQTLVLKSRSATVTLDGSPVRPEDCGLPSQNYSADAAWSYDYYVSQSQLMLLSAPTEPCDSSERDEFLFGRI
jgi:hypothetical protein